jgi:hypothetical protein
VLSRLDAEHDILVGEDSRDGVHCRGSDDTGAQVRVSAADVTKLELTSSRERLAEGNDVWLHSVPFGAEPADRWEPLRVSQNPVQAGHDAERLTFFRSWPDQSESRRR